jgi:Spatacsin C-terminus
VARAYGCPVAWGKALTHHFVLNNRPEYLEAFGRRNVIGVALVEEAIVAFEAAEPSRKMSAEQTERLSVLVSSLSDVEAKYRIASRLGLRSMVRTLLSSSGLPYLKDSAWKTANQY